MNDFIMSFWKNIAAQDADSLKRCFHENAYINWHNTNEHFTAGEFIRANCEYPGNWEGCVERIEHLNGLYVSVAKVWLKDESASYHAVSFFEFEGDKIISLNEYWGDDGPPPQWRLEKHIGTKINE